MLNFLNSTIVSTFALKTANKALFRTNLAPRIKSNLAILFLCHFGHFKLFHFHHLQQERHTKHIIPKAERFPIEIHNVMSHILGGWVALNL